MALRYQHTAAQRDAELAARISAAARAKVGPVPSLQTSIESVRGHSECQEPLF